ncbi:hypothetical protein [Tenacibaculum amylolyticum]|uniref:hypothetical protein n=1 Tax=Tenacibaculum amylolyticum TaxID=104269 RepID=UPI003894F469
MKRDIRELFKENSPKKKMPIRHRELFEQKLTKAPRKKILIYKIKNIAVILAFICIGAKLLFINDSSITSSKEAPIIHQVHQIEAQYLKSIDEEWEKLLQITDDQYLIVKYEKRLDKLSNEYQNLSQRFKKESNNINLLEELINNLQIRLETLKSIQNHIKNLNKKEIAYETIDI